MTYVTTYSTSSISRLTLLLLHLLSVPRFHHNCPLETWFPAFLAGWVGTFLPLQIHAESPWPPSQPRKQLPQRHAPQCSQGPRWGLSACRSPPHPPEDRHDISSHLGPLGCHDRSNVRRSCLAHPLPQRPACLQFASGAQCNPLPWVLPLTPNDHLAMVDLADKDQGKETLQTSVFSCVLHHRVTCLIQQQTHIFFCLHLLTTYLWKSFLLLCNPLEFQIQLNFPNVPSACLYPS